MSDNMDNKQNLKHMLPSDQQERGARAPIWCTQLGLLGSSFPPYRTFLLHLLSGMLVANHVDQQTNPIRSSEGLTVSILPVVGLSYGGC